MYSENMEARYLNRFVSKDRTDRLRALLAALAEEMGVQFVIVTHDPGLMVGHVVDLTEG